MKIAAIAFTKNGGKIVKMLVREFGARGYIISKHHTDGLEDFDNLSGLVKDIFKKYNALIFVGACGIAVRAVAPYIKDKSKDPAVVVVDEEGNFAIPVLSGHIGGANDLAKKIAALTNGTAVITTATDINDKFSVDTFAVKNNLHIRDTKLIKEISSRVLEGQKIGLYTDYELKNIPDCFTDTAEVGICISDEDKKHIFTRFYSGSGQPADSIGIGLSLAEAIVRHDNGYILVEDCKKDVLNEKNECSGTRFVVRYL